MMPTLDPTGQTMRDHAVGADTQTATPAAYPTVAAKVGRFTLLAQLGEGAMGVVYSAYDEALDRRVAIKILKARDIVDSAATGLRMRREAQALARLNHPNVAQVFEVGESEGQAFVAMEYVAGQTLSAWRSEHAPSWRELLAMYLQAGHGLAAAHAAGLVHRDFKPNASHPRPQKPPQPETPWISQIRGF